MLAAVAGAVLSGAWALDSHSNRAEEADRCAAIAAASDARAHIVTGSGAPVVVIGDSWSTGHGIANVARSWPSLLPGRVEVYGFDGSGFAERASPCPGEAFADRIPASVATASLVVLEGGLNDYDQPAGAIRSGFRRTLLGLAELHVDPSRVVALGPPRAPARAAGAERVGRILRDECERSAVRYVATGDLRLDYLRDRLHLTLRGHREFGDAVARRLR